MFMNSVINCFLVLMVWTVNIKNSQKGPYEQSIDGPINRFLSNLFKKFIGLGEVAASKKFIY